MFFDCKLQVNKKIYYMSLILKANIIVLKTFFRELNQIEKYNFLQLHIAS